jgi:predicted dienelactone hydrolase
MKFLFCVFFFLEAQLSLASINYEVGQKDFSLRDETRKRQLSTYVWYPTTVKANPAKDRRGPFLPVVATKDAPIARGLSKFPVVLLSHGSGGKADKLFWLTSYLVRHGVIVIAIDHPGNMTGDNSADGMMRVWERAKDLTFALDHLLQKSDFRAYLDITKLAATGHSAGGATVLLLAGARLSSTRFISPVPFCEGSKDPYFAGICNELKTLDLKKYSQKTVEDDYSDPRVKAIVGLDPGMAQSFEPNSLKNLKIKAMLLIADKLNSPQDQIFSKNFLELLPAKAAEIVPNSYHMTFFQACRPDFPKNDPELREICIRSEEKVKAQGEIAKRILEFFTLAWTQ